MAPLQIWEPPVEVPEPGRPTDRKMLESPAPSSAGAEEPSPPAPVEEAPPIETREEPSRPSPSDPDTLPAAPSPSDEETEK